MYKTILFLLLIILYSCDENKTNQITHTPSVNTKKSEIHYKQEKHLANIKQLTFGGDNAEAYFSFDDSKLVFQLRNPEIGVKCDQIYVLDYNNHDMKKSLPPMVSTGLGRTTCSYFMPGDTNIIYASTHLGDKNCPKEPTKREDGAYVWPIYADFDIFVADMNGKIVNQLTHEPGYIIYCVINPLAFFALNEMNFNSPFRYSLNTIERIFPLSFDKSIAEKYSIDAQLTITGDGDCSRILFKLSVIDCFQKSYRFFPLGF